MKLDQLRFTEVAKNIPSVLAFYSIRVVNTLRVVARGSPKVIDGDKNLSWARYKGQMIADT